MWMRGIVAKGYGGRPPFLLVLGWLGSIRSINDCQGTTSSISARNFSPLVAPPCSAFGLCNGALLSRRLLVIRKAKLIDCHQLRTER